MEQNKDLIDASLKQLKTGEELNNLLAQIQKRGIEKILEGELDDHLGYQKNEGALKPNAWNGYFAKMVKTSFGDSEIQVPKDRDATFNPMLIPKRKSMAEGLKSVIVSLHARGMSVSDIEV